MNFHHLQKEYNLFVNKFMVWAGVAGVEAHVPARSNVDVSRNDRGQIEVRSLFHFPNWPVRSAKKKAKSALTILLRTREVYEDDYVLVKSNVNTIYFRQTRKDLPAKAHTALHYDYEYRMGVAHPMFHAQFGAKPIPDQDLLDVQFSRQLDLSALDPIESIRIPTVHVGLPAALLAVTADHLSSEAYLGFLEFASQNRFFNEVATIRLNQCRQTKLHDLDQWVFRSHNIYA